MSEADNQALSVLLPPAKLSIFSEDKTTLNSGRALAQDWRFARVKIGIKQGTVDTAIEYYKQNTSPNLIIIQTEDIDESFTNKLSQLAGYLEEGSSAIVLGPVNDVNLYRRLIDMGVSDYLVKPIEVKLLADSIAKTLVDRVGAMGSRLLAFVGAKGGVGASAVAVASAWAIADFLGEKALFFDAAAGWSTTAVSFGFEPATTLIEAVRAAENDDEQGFERMLHPASKKLSVLATGGDGMIDQSPNPDQLERLFSMMMTKFPIVIGDFSGAPPELVRTAVSRANHTILVSTATVTSLRLARTLLMEMKEVRGGEDKDISLLINKQGLAGKNDVPYKDIQEAMEFPVSGIIPFVPETFHSIEAESMKLQDTKQGYDIMNKVVMPVLQKALDINKDKGPGEDSPAEGVFGGFLNMLKK